MQTARQRNGCSTLHLLLLLLLCVPALLRFLYLSTPSSTPSLEVQLSHLRQDLASATASLARLERSNEALTSSLRALADAPKLLQFPPANPSIQQPALPASLPILQPALPASLPIQQPALPANPPIQQPALPASLPILQPALPKGDSPTAPLLSPLQVLQPPLSHHAKGRSRTADLASSAAPAPRKRVLSDSSYLPAALRPKSPYTIHLHPAKKDFVSDRIFTAGTFEVNVAESLASALGGPASPSNPPRTLIDIGTNIGAHTLLALALGHTVISVEPFSRNTRLLLGSVAENAGFQDRFTLHQVALADAAPENGTQALCIISTQEATNMGNARLIPLQEPPTPEEAASGTCHGRWRRTVAPVGEVWEEHEGGPSAQVGERVRVTTLDAALGGEVRADVMKLDIEGFEAKALAGATHLLARQLPCTILFEVNAFVTRASGVDANALPRNLLARGYSIAVPGRKRLALARVQATDVPALTDGDYEAFLEAPRCAARERK